MKDIVDLAIPCRMVTLTVLIGPEEGLTTLENLVSRAIPAGRGTVDDLARLFALPKRIILDVVHSLWSKGHIVVSFETGELELAEGTRDLLTKGGLPQESAKRERRRFLFEPVTGTIFPEHKRVRRPRENSLEVPHHHGVTEADLSSEQLLAAVQSVFQHDQRKHGFRSNVLDVSFGSPVLRAPDELAWYQTHATVTIDEATNRLNVTLDQEDRLWSLRARGIMAHHLAELGDQEPQHPFVQGLRGRAQRKLAPQETLPSLLRKAERDAKRLDHVQPGQLDALHDDLVDVATRIYDRLNAAVRNRADAQLVERFAGHQWVVEDLIRSARNQLVVVSPYVSYTWLNQLLPQLEEALRRGVSVVLLWGRSATDSLDHPVHTALTQLKNRYSSRFLLSDRSARTSACVVIQDHERAMVGSHSPLALNPREDQSSVLIEPHSSGPVAPQVIGDLLLWCRKAYPYYQESLRIQQSKNFDTPERAVAPERTVTGIAPTPTLPDPPPEVFDQAAVDLWAGTWRPYLTALQESARSTLAAAPAVQLIRDGSHRDMMSRAFQEGRERLVVLDDWYDARTTSAIASQLIQDRIEKGVRVDLTHPTPKGKEGGGPLAALAKDKRVRVRHQKAPARALMWDEHLVIGSHAPLGENPRSGRVHRTHQLGVHVRDLSFTDAFARSLGIPVPERTDDRPQRARSTMAEDAAAAAFPLLNEARQAEGNGGFATVLRRRLTQYGHPWLILEAWEKAGVSSRDLRRAAALLLSEHEGIPAEARRHWVAWLISDAWGRRAFVEAALISRLAPEGLPLLPPSLCLATSVLEVGPLDDQLLEAVIPMADLDLPPAALQLGGLAGLAEALLWGGEGGPDVAGMFEEHLGPGWRALSDAVAEFSRYAPGTALPFRLFHAELTQSTEQAVTEEAWAELVKEITHIEQLQNRFGFESGAALHKGLFSSDSILVLIRKAARDRRLRPELAGRLPENTHHHLDGIVRAAGAEPISWARHKFFLNRVDDIVRQGRELSTGTHTGQTTTVVDPTTVTASERLGKQLAQSWDQLFSEAQSLERPHRLPALAFLDQLQPLHQWYQECR